ncbi:hypothetical protein [Microbacterium resistens]|uniref:hypothetical protein n=1 Tax=Microbacterium resistens TaxID=156977 RepID=UPI00366C1077
MTDETDAETSEDTQGAVIWMGLLLIGTFMLLPFIPVMLLAGPGLEHFGDAVAIVAEWCAPLLEDFLSLAAVVATLLVALAAATNFGQGNRVFDARARAGIGALVMIGVFTVAVVAAGTVIVAVADPRQFARVMPAIAVAWACILLGQLVGDGATRKARESQAKELWAARLARAEDAGVDPDEVLPSPGKRLRTEAVVWVVPFVAWAGLVALVVLAGPAWMRTAPVILIALFLHTASYFLTAAWRSTADLSTTARGRRIQAIAFRATGIAMAVALSIPLFAVSRLGVIAVLFLLCTGVQVVVLGVPRIRSRFRAITSIERWATISSLRRSRRWAQRLSRERVPADG